MFFFCFLKMNFIKFLNAKLSSCPKYISMTYTFTTTLNILYIFMKILPFKNQANFYYLSYLKNGYIYIFLYTYSSCNAWPKYSCG